MAQYLFTEEWDEGCKEMVAAYGKRTEEEVENICNQMEKYSTYDYCCPCIFDTKQEYLIALRCRMDNGCKITDHEKEL